MNLEYHELDIPLIVRATVWEGGYFKHYLGTIHRIDDIGKKECMKKRGLLHIKV